MSIPAIVVVFTAPNVIAVDVVIMFYDFRGKVNFLRRREKLRENNFSTEIPGLEAVETIVNRAVFSPSQAYSTGSKY